jgi:hypothetical protein
MLSAPDPGLPPGEPPRPVCQRCGRSVDEGAIGAQVGLCHCMICEVYACRWCWADGDGTCPSCGVRYAPAALLAVGQADELGVATAVVTGAVVADAGEPSTSAVVAGAGALSTLGRRPDIRAPLAIGTLVVALALLGLAFGGPLGSTAGSIGATPTPAFAVVAGTGSDATGSPSAAASSGDGIGSSAPSAVPTSTGRLPASTPEPPTATPTPAVTSAPAPRTTATPVRTPRPTAKPTPTPQPTPTCKVVPQLVGSTVGAARAAWTAAGFTGAFSPLGHNAAIVTKQNHAAGACLAASTTITVEYTKAT